MAEDKTETMIKIWSGVTAELAAASWLLSNEARRLERLGYNIQKLHGAYNLGTVPADRATELTDRMIRMRDPLLKVARMLGEADPLLEQVEELLPKGTA